MEVWHRLLPLQEWRGFSLIQNFSLSCSGRSCRALPVWRQDWQHLQAIQILWLPCQLMPQLALTHQREQFQQKKQSDHEYYSLSSVVPISFWQFVNVDFAYRQKVHQDICCLHLSSYCYHWVENYSKRSFCRKLLQMLNHLQQCWSVMNIIIASQWFS